jgi:hypothetical protein
MAASDPRDATFAIKKAVRAALLANSTLNLALQGLKVVDAASTKHATPYISWDTSSDDWSTATEDGQVIVLDLNVWDQPSSRTPETANGRDIMSIVRETLHTATLFLDTPFHCVQIRVEAMIGPYRDPDGQTLHGVVTIRALVDHA